MKKELENTKLINGKRQAPNLKKILTKAAFTNNQLGSIKPCGDKKCKCCNAIYESSTYTFKNANYKFELKSHMTCDSRNLIYVVICPGCSEEYIGETGIGKTTQRDRVRVYRQHIKDEHLQQLKVEGHLRDCGKGQFKIFPFLQLKSSNTNFRRSYEKYFQQKFKTKLNR